jgi:hypothetical protein
MCVLLFPHFLSHGPSGRIGTLALELRAESLAIVLQKDSQMCFILKSISTLTPCLTEWSL